jgi:hypothetical protein
LALTAEALLREHPEALVCGLASTGLIVPMPPEVPLWGQVAVEGRALIDHVVTSDLNNPPAMTLPELLSAYSAPSVERALVAERGGT